MTLNELLSCLPEVRSRYGPFEHFLGSMISPGSSYGDPFSIGPPHALGQLHGLTTDGEFSSTQAEVLWAAYPGLESLPLPQRRIDDPDFIAVSGTPGQVTVRVNERSEAVSHRGYWHPRGSVIYRGTRWLFPYVGDPRIEVHPLTAWWLILFACSVMSRYDASRWTSLLDVRHSPHASMLEYVLDLAPEAVPNVIATTLDGIA